MGKNTIIITGGAQRLGLYNAEKLNQAGYEVVVTYRTPRDEIEQIEHRGIKTVQADFSTEEGIDNFIHRMRLEYGALRALVHNASLWYPDSEIVDKPKGLSRFMELVHVHMMAPFKINYGLRDLIKTPPSPFAECENAESSAGVIMGDIIHMTDFVVEKGSKHHVAYSSTKAALENMTRSFAAQFGPAIKVNSIAPALVKFNTHDSDAYRKKAAHKSIMGFEPGEEVNFRALEYLLHNSYVTGTCLHLDGGRHLVVP